MIQDRGISIGQLGLISNYMGDIGSCSYSGCGEGGGHNPKILLPREAYDCWKLSYVFGRSGESAKACGILCLVLQFLSEVEGHIWLTGNYRRPVQPGMVVKTNSPIVHKAREGVMEFLLAVSIPSFKYLPRVAANSGFRTIHWIAVCIQKDDLYEFIFRG